MPRVNFIPVMRSLHEIPGGLSVCHSSASHSLVPFKAMTHGQEILSQHMATPVTRFCDWHKINLFSSLICCFYIISTKRIRRHCIQKPFTVAFKKHNDRFGILALMNRTISSQTYTHSYSIKVIFYEVLNGSLKISDRSTVLVFEHDQELEQSKK